MTLTQARRLGIVWSDYMNASGHDRTRIVFFLITGSTIVVFSVRVKYLEIAHIERVQLSLDRWDNMYITHRAQELTSRESEILSKILEPSKKKLIAFLFKKTLISSRVSVDQFI